MAVSSALQLFRLHRKLAFPELCCDVQVSAISSERISHVKSPTKALSLVVIKERSSKVVQQNAITVAILTKDEAVNVRNAFLRAPSQDSELSV
jgi:hypothetical protein